MKVCYLLTACFIVATFESPIGQSVDGYVIRHTVSWCPDYYDGSPRIHIEERVVDNKAGRMIGNPAERIFTLPTHEKPAVEAGQEGRPLGTLP